MAHAHPVFPSPPLSSRPALMLLEPETPLSCPWRQRGWARWVAVAVSPPTTSTLPGGAMGTKVSSLTPARSSGLAGYFLPGFLAHGISMILFMLFLSSSNLSKWSASHATSQCFSPLSSPALATPCCYHTESVTPST